MLADVVCVIWVVLSGLLGAYLGIRAELYRLTLLVGSYAVARVVGVTLAESLAAKLYGVMGASLIVALVLWPVLYWTVRIVFEKIFAFRRHPIRVNFSPDGEMIVGHSPFWKRLFGGLIGAVRGGALFVGLLSLLIPLTPLLFSKAGKGTAILHPASKVLRWIRQQDPRLTQIEAVARGLRSMRYAQRSRRMRRRAERSKEARQILRNRSVRSLFKRRALLNAAHSRKEGRKDAMLLLWRRDFQELVFQPYTSFALATLGTILPAPGEKSSSL